MQVGRVLYWLQHGVVQASCVLFRVVGCWVGEHAVLSICASLLLSLLCSIGLLQLTINQDTDTGYLTADSPALHEFAVFEQFHQSSGSGQPYHFGLLVRAKDNCSLLRHEHLAQLHSLYDWAFSQVVLQETLLHRPNVTFDQICGIYCLMMEPLWIFKKVWLSGSNSTVKQHVQLQYPMSQAYGYQLNMAPYLYGVTEDTATATGTVEGVKVIALWFGSDQRRNATMGKVIKQWEMSVFERAKQVTASDPLLSVSPYGKYCINMEVLRAGSEVVPFYSLGFALMLSLIGGTLFGSELHYGQLGRGWMVLTVAAVLSPVLATAATFGTLTSLGYHTNVMMMIAPFLILAIGVDDAFLLTHCWQRLALHQERKVLSKADRLGLIMSESGPSIFVTSLTNSLAFSIGGLASPPEISLFCMSVALGMAFAFIFQVTFFGPVMLLCSSDTPVDNEPAKRSVWQVRGSECVARCNQVLLSYCKWLTSCWGRALALVSFVLYLAVAVAGVLVLKAELDPRQIMPKGSIIMDTLDIRRDYLWREYHPVEVIVNKALNLSLNSTDHVHLDNLLTDLESLPRSLGHEMTWFWLKHFEQFVAIDTGSMFDIFGIEGQPSSHSDKLNQLPDFLKMSRNEHWTHDINWHYDSQSNVVVDSFKLRVAFGNISSLGVRAKAVSQWRAVIGRYSTSLNATLWDADAPYSDIILNVRSITTRSLLVTLVSMALVCALFIPYTTGLLCAVAAIMSICTGVIGFLSWWGANLDPVTMADMIMAVGFSVDYTAHISYHYYTARESLPQGTNCERLHHAFQAVLWPMVQAGTSTMICMLPQTQSTMAAHILFVKSVVLVVMMGLAHGVFWVPALLTTLSTSPKPTILTKHTKEVNTT